MDEGPIASCFPVKESQYQRGTRGIAQAHIYEVNLPWELRLHLLQMANKHLPESWRFSFNALSLAELRILMWREIQLLHKEVPLTAGFGQGCFLILTQDLRRQFENHLR